VNNDKFSDKNYEKIVDKLYSDRSEEYIGFTKTEN
jgi:hypothetical protein